MKLGKIVKNYRDRLDLTLEQLNKKTGLSKGFISRLEKGDYDEKNISLNSIIKLARGFDIKVKEILDALNVIEQNEPPSLRMYLREKYNISKNEDADMIENLINHFKE